MKKILLGTLAIVSLSAVASANTQIQFPAEKLGGNDLSLIVADADVRIDGTSHGRLAANVEFFGGSPMLACFVWAYDSEDPLNTGLTMEQWINDEGAVVQLADMRFVVTCADGTVQSYVRTNGYAYNVGVPFPTNLPTTMPFFTECPTDVPPACAVDVTTLDFGTVIHPAPVQLSFQICNVGGGTLVGTVTENCPTFSIVAGADYSLAAGECQTVMVEFIGDHSGPTVCDILAGDCAVIAIVNDVVAGTETPAVFALSEAYPNPFNPTTTLSYSVPENQEVTLNVYNTNGQLVKTLVNGMVERGEHKVVFDASDLASGVYVYTLKTASQSAMHKMVLVK